MGKAVKNLPHSPASAEIPNRKTREAMKAVDRGEVKTAKDAGDLLKKLKS